MMELIEKYDEKYNEYERLLIERDRYINESERIWTGYLLKFGSFMQELYEIKIDCIKKKKTVAFCRKVLNHGEKLNPDEVSAFISEQMKSYYSNLKKLAEKVKNAKKAGFVSVYEIERSKTLYRRLVKLLHPDINPETDKNEKLSDLWARVTAAYMHTDIRLLSELEVLAKKMLKELGLGVIKADIPDIDDRIEELNNEISDIVTTEPYTLKEYIEDEDLMEDKIREFETEIQSYKEYRKELAQIIAGLIARGGLNIKWEMN